MCTFFKKKNEISMNKSYVCDFLCVCMYEKKKKKKKKNKNKNLVWC